MNTFQRLISRLFVPAMLAATAVVGMQCIEAPLPPIAPTSDIALSIPIADIKKFASEFFSDTSIVKRAGDGSLFFSQTNAGAPAKLDTIKVVAAPSANQVNVGLIQVDPVPASNSDIQILPHGKNSDLPFPLNTIAIPASDTVVPGFALPSLTSQFGFLSIATGALNLSITNTTPTTMKFPNGITLRNDTVDTNPVANFVFSPDSITPGQTGNAAPISLTGKTMRGKLKIDPIHIQTSKIDTPYDINSSNDHITFGFGSTALVVDSAEAKIPSQTIAAINDSVIVIDDSVSVADGRFASGLFNAKIVNNLGITVGVFLKFGNFVSTTSPTDTFTIQKVLPGHDSLTVSVRMDTIRLVNGSPAPIGTSMKFSVGINTITSAGIKATISNKDYVRAEFNPQQAFSVKSITGRIKPLTVPLLSKMAGPDLGAVTRVFTGGFTFDSVQIAVNLGLSGGFPTGYNLKFIAKSTKLNRLDTLPIPGNLFDPGVNGNVITKITLDNSSGLNTFLGKFYPNFPDSFFVVGSATVNQGFTQRTISDTAKLSTSVSIYFPVKIGLSNGKVNTGAPLDAESFPKDITKNVKTAGVNFMFVNGLPFTMGFTMKLIGDTGTNHKDTLLRIPSTGSLTILGAKVSPLDGSASDTSVSLVPISLTGSQMAMFNRADSTLFEFTMQTSGTLSQPVKVRLQDYLRVKVSGKLVYTIKGGGGK